MRKLIALEELAQFGLAVYFLSRLSINYNYYLLIPAFFAPDLFAAGYLVNKFLGAMMYNFSHHKLIAVVLIVIGLMLNNEYGLLSGLLAYAHSSFDRMIGYGLKYLDSPDHTHLGFIGKKKFQNPADSF